MKTIVTGGGGFIGRHLVQFLTARGESVRVVEKPGVSVTHQPDVEVVFADIRDRTAIRNAMCGARRVYHLAANPQLWTRRRGHFRQVNYLGTVNVLDEALAAGAERVLHCSTESILTRATQTAAIAEDQEVSLDDVIGPYCRSKFFAERYARRLANEGKPVVIVNPTLPIGPGDTGLSPPTQMVLDCCRGKRSAYLEADLNLIDVRDVARGMALAMNHGQPGKRYLLGAENWSVKRVFDLLADECGLPRPKWAVPYPVALVAAYVSEFVADVFTGTMPAASVTGVKLTQRTMTFDASRSLNELGLKPRPVRESLREMLGWFREVGWLKRGP
ncbi:NAD-dependent epimerase/dehydratase family protein [Limnoglobus roseus]|uniref:Oxidoreductase n=1 Tax=Limnoglobus roseus TaxID=2598579 RepID=A0A5C1AGT1_9BACT|nr:NAD-dependent epimerase/dehydratase family protein [Limnoglobus roseus]QEL17367.1 oxidoreductase [Limnoglobus roseus]